MPADPFDVCDRLEESIKALLGDEAILADLQRVRFEDDGVGETDHLRICCEEATEYQNKTGIWVVKTAIKLSVHGLDAGARDRLLTLWRPIHQVLRRTDLPDALTTTKLRVHGSRAWAVTRRREESSWVREIAAELLASLRAD